MVSVGNTQEQNDAFLTFYLCFFTQISYLSCPSATVSLFNFILHFWNN